VDNECENVEKTQVLSTKKNNPNDAKTRIQRPSTANPHQENIDLEETILMPAASKQAGSGSVDSEIENTRIHRPNEQSSTSASEQLTQLTFANTANTKGLLKAQAIARESADTKNLVKKRFLLETTLGAGGMGTVYKAQDLRKVEAEDKHPYVAVKVLNEGFKQHPQAYVSLQQEAVKSQKLAHPNIVTVYDFDRDGDTIFMTMELLQGTPLDACLKSVANRGIEKNEAVGHFNQLCNGLSYAHARNIVHSDFKPGNIFLTDDGSAKILDFGIARAVSQAKADSNFDAGSLGALTPSYASYEMFQGEPPHFSDDIYALACVFYEMLTGQHPYNRTPANQALEKGLTPKRIKSLTRREWRALEKGLALTISDRWQSVAEFQKAFAPALRAKQLWSAVGVASVGLIAAGWAIYGSYQDSAQLKSTIEKAQHCLEQKDYQCAIENSVVVLNAQPNNSNALTLNKVARDALAKSKQLAVVEKLIEEAKDCFQANEVDCASLKLNELLALDQKNTQAKKLLSIVDQQGIDNRIGVLMSDANHCLDENDYACVNRLIAKAELISLHHVDVVAVKSRRNQQWSQQQAANQQRSEQVAALLGQAQRCLKENKYQCAIKESESALALQPGNDQAIAVRRTAEIAMVNEINQRKVIDGMLIKARQCLTAKNYSCAISTTDAALAMDPKHVQSLALKKKAEQEQLRIKRSISIY